MFAPVNQNRGIGIIGDNQSSTDREDLLRRRPRPLWFTLYVGTTVQSTFESPQCIGHKVCVAPDNQEEGLCTSHGRHISPALVCAVVDHVGITDNDLLLGRADSYIVASTERVSCLNIDVELFNH